MGNWEYGSNSLGEVDSRNLEIQIHLSFHIWSFKFFLLRNKLCCQAPLTQKNDSDIFSWQKKWWGQNSIGLCGMVTRWQEHFVLHFERWGDGVFVRRWRCINPRCEQWMLRITSIVLVTGACLRQWRDLFPQGSNLLSATACFGVDVWHLWYAPFWELVCSYRLLIVSISDGRFG